MGGREAIDKRPSGAVTENTLTYPEPYEAADRAAGRARDEGHVLVAAALIFGVASAGLDIVPWKSGETDWAAFTSGCSFALALICGVILACRRPERRWHALRAVAEGVRSLSWQYAMHVAPFDGDDATKQLVERLRALSLEAAQYGVRSPGDVVLEDLGIPDSAMGGAQAYMTARLDDQIAYYEGKGRAHRLAHHVWLVVSLVCQMVGIAAALARAFWGLDVDLLGLAATAAAAATAWTRARDHGGLSDVYSKTCEALKAEREHLVTRSDDATVVAAKVEGILASEHARWLQRRAVLGLSAG